jgi:hypothetical protein
MERYTSDPCSGPGYKDPLEERDDRLCIILEERSTAPRWISADKWKEEDDAWYVSNEIYSGRNYYLFSILANVRSGGSIPISNPRGVPKDASYAYRMELKKYEGDAHSKSYFTLTELLNVNWNNYDKGDLFEFLDSIESMKKIDANTDNVRCVFFFDN